MVRNKKALELIQKVYVCDEKTIKLVKQNDALEDLETIPNSLTSAKFKNVNALQNIIVFGCEGQRIARQNLRNMTKHDYDSAEFKDKALITRTVFLNNQTI